MRHALTLIELAVAMTIVAVLIGLLLVAVPNLRFNARAYDTTQRLQQVTTGLTQYGSGEGSSCAALQRAFVLGGIAEFASVKVILNRVGFDGGRGETSSNGPNLWPDNWSGNAKWDGTKGVWRRLRADVFEAVPTPAQHSQTWYLATWPTRWPESDWDRDPPGIRPPLLRFPWGRPGMRIDGSACDPVLAAGTVIEGGIVNSWNTHGANAASDVLRYSVAEATQTAHVVGPVEVDRSNGVTETVASNAPLPFDLGRCSPLRSVELLQAAGILPPGASGADGYRSDRSSTKRWNDAWGQPLVVTYALFQPERFTRTYDNYDRRDVLLKGALATYQYNRALYVAAGAIGPSLRIGADAPTWTDEARWAATEDALAARKMWRQIRENTKAWEWNERSWITPAWSGVRIGTGTERCFVAAPVEIK